MECPNCKDVRYKIIAPCQVCGYMSPQLQQQMYQQQMMYQQSQQQGFYMPQYQPAYQEPTDSPLSIVSVILGAMLLILGWWGFLGMLILFTTLIIACIDISINKDKYKIKGSVFALVVVFLYFIIYLIQFL